MDLTAQLEGERLTHAKAVEALREELQKRTRASVTNEAELRTRFAAVCSTSRPAHRERAMADGFAALRCWGGRLTAWSSAFARRRGCPIDFWGSAGRRGQRMQGTGGSRRAVPDT